MLFTIIIGIFLILTSCGNPNVKTSDTENSMSFSSTKVSLLFFSKTAAFRHESIPSGLSGLKKIARQSNWKWTATEDASIFHPDSLPNFDAVVLLNTTGDVFDENQQLALRQYLQSGGALLGIHSATDTEYDWPWYQKCMAAAFDHHPAEQEARLIVHQEQQHPAIAHLPKEWKVYDEWYYFQQPVGAYVTPLISLDEESIVGEKSNGMAHPLCWYHEFEGGRVFYTALGHTKAIYQNPDFLQHLKGAIEWLTEK